MPTSFLNRSRCCRYIYRSVCHIKMTLPDMWTQFARLCCSTVNKLWRNFNKQSVMVVIAFEYICVLKWKILLNCWKFSRNYRFWKIWFQDYAFSRKKNYHSSITSVGDNFLPPWCLLFLGQHIVTLNMLVGMQDHRHSSMSPALQIHCRGPCFAQFYFHVLLPSCMLSNVCLSSFYPHYLPTYLLLFWRSKCNCLGVFFSCFCSFCFSSCAV